jgi:hypothetical protein
MDAIIDVDAHFEPGRDWLEPYPELAARLPKLDAPRLAVDTIVGDLLRDVPVEERPPLDELTPPGLLTLFGDEKREEAERREEFEGKNQFQVANAKARIQWMDEQGIALQNVICLSGFAYNTQIDDRVAPVAELFLGKSKLPMRPSEYLARNVRATPLAAGNDQPLLRIMEDLPDDMLLFSSDFPYFEGFTDPIGHYGQALKELSPERRERFCGGAIADVYARMGDPIA